MVLNSVLRRSFSSFRKYRCCCVKKGCIYMSFVGEHSTEDIGIKTALAYLEFNHISMALLQSCRPEVGGEKKGRMGTMPPSRLWRSRAPL